MREQIPKLRESIKDASMRDLKDFLENIRKYSSKMGEIAMRHAAGNIININHLTLLTVMIFMTRLFFIILVFFKCLLLFF